jgi:hypothetical protein
VEFRQGSRPQRARPSGSPETSGHFMAHLSITEATGDQRPEADWGEHVTENEYGSR